MGILSTIKGIGVAAKVFAVANAPGLLVAGAIVGVGLTVYSAFKAGKKTGKIIREEEQKKKAPLTTGEKAKATWKVWTPVIIEGVLTCTAMGLSYWIHAHRLAQAVQASQILLATNNELQNKLNYISEKHPEITDELAEYDSRVACGAMTTNAESDVSGPDLFYDPFFRVKWWSDYSFMVEAIADSKESFLYSGYLGTQEVYDRFRVKVKDRPKAIGAFSWKDDSCPGSSKVPRINIKCAPMLDENGYPIKGKTMYVLEYNPPDLSTTWDMYSQNRPYGYDGPSWEDSIICEDEYSEIANQYAQRKGM